MGTGTTFPPCPPPAAPAAAPTAAPAAPPYDVNYYPPHPSNYPQPNGDGQYPYNHPQPNGDDQYPYNHPQPNGDGQYPHNPPPMIIWYIQHPPEDMAGGENGHYRVFPYSFPPDSYPPYLVDSYPPYPPVSYPPQPPYPPRHPQPLRSSRPPSPIPALPPPRFPGRPRRIQSYYSADQSLYNSHRNFPPPPLRNALLPEFLHKSPPGDTGRLALRRMPDPEAKLFIGDLPMQESTQKLVDMLDAKFGRFGLCEVNVAWNPRMVNEKALPTGWVQYKNFIDANVALLRAQNEPILIGNRRVRVERADGKRMFRLYPSDFNAKPTLEDFKAVMNEFIHWGGKRSAYRMPIHVSDKIEMMVKNLKGQQVQVPSVGIMFRWCEDAQFAESKFHMFTPLYKIKTGHMEITNRPHWQLPTEPPEPHTLASLDALDLDPGNKWREERENGKRRRELYRKHRARIENLEGSANHRYHSNKNDSNSMNMLSPPVLDFAEMLPPDILRSSSMQKKPGPDFEKPLSPGFTLVNSRHNSISEDMDDVKVERIAIDGEVIVKIDGKILA